MPMDNEEELPSPPDFKPNVVMFPTVNKKPLIIDPDMSPENAKNIAMEKINELAKNSTSIFGLCIDKTTGQPSLVMGGYADPAIVNMFIDLIKIQLQETFMEMSTKFIPE